MCDTDMAKLYGSQLDDVLRAYEQAVAEPYRGVAALFDADVHRRCPQWAPRQDWTVDRSGRLHYQRDTGATSHP